MELNTFRNLNPERQEEILMVAYEEFALKGYRSASLSEIIKKLGLAKGSFYRYFDSKRNLYAYLLTDATQRRMSNLHLLVEEPGMDIFELIKQNFIAKTRFEIENPTIGGFLFRTMLERDESEVADLVKGLFNRLIDKTIAIISLDKFKGQLANLPPDLMAFQIFNMQLWLYDYIAFKFNLNYEQNIRNNQPILNIDDAELNRVFDQLMWMLKQGIQLKTEQK
jgi:TetR/AcrR family transcriptional regulator